LIPILWNYFSFNLSESYVVDTTACCFLPERAS
jgi:hypothetical protein